MNRRKLGLILNVWFRMALAPITLILLTAFAPLGFAASRPNILLILADDLGYSDLGCYGSRGTTPNLDKLAAGGLRFTQFYNSARCCPTRASLLTGLYPHQAGVGHMTEDWTNFGAAYGPGLNDRCATIAELLHDAGYRNYHVGKWHVGGVGGKADARNHPMNRGFDRAYGTGGGGSHFTLPLYLDREPVKAGDDFYSSDAFTEYAVKFLEEHGREHKNQPFFLHLCYTAPHFPLHAKPADIAKYRGKFRDGWDAERDRRLAQQKQLGIFKTSVKLSARDPVAKAWAEVPEPEREEWDLRMAVHAAMIDCMDQGIGRVLEALRKTGATQNTLVLFLSDNGASAEALDSWPNPARGHQPGSEVGTKESHRCLEVAWANAANTPFREHKMWVHEGGIGTPLIVNWPAGIAAKGNFTREVGHVTDFMPTFLELAGATYPKIFRHHELTPLPGRSLVPTFTGGKLGERRIGWEHEGNRALRAGDWKLVATYQGPWELYNLKQDRSELNNLAAKQPTMLKELSAGWQAWADKVGVVPWEKLPGANYKPTAGYRKKSEPVAP